MDYTFSLKIKKCINTRPTFLHGKYGQELPTLGRTPALQFSTVPTRPYCPPTLRWRPPHSLPASHIQILFLCWHLRWVPFQNRSERPSRQEHSSVEGLIKDEQIRDLEREVGFKYMCSAWGHFFWGWTSKWRCSRGIWKYITEYI